MPENNAAANRANVPPEPPDAGHVPMSEEFDRAKWTLPPVGVVVGALLVIAVIVAIVSIVNVPKPALSGNIGDVTAAETQDKSVLVAINISLKNLSEKPVVLQNIKAKLTTDKGEFEDSAASGADFGRYFQAFPALKANAQPPFQPETKIQPGSEASGTIIVSFPVDKQAFDGRKSLNVVVEPYYVKPLTLSQ